MASVKNQETFSRLSLFLKSIREKQSDIILVIGVILVALIGFGLGQLTAPGQKCQPLIFEDGGLGQSLQSSVGAEQEPNISLPMLQGAAGAASGLMNSPVSATSSPQQVGKEGLLVGSKNSNKYHWPWCPFAQKIKPSNQVWFSSEAQAQAAGYTRCSKFLELAPANYKP